MLFRTRLVPGVFAPALLLVTAGACSSEPGGTTTTETSPTRPPCGQREVTVADGSCVPVGPHDPGPHDGDARNPHFARSADGWGLTPIHGDSCKGSTMARLGESACAS